ncbi:MAG: hypothetical protein WBG57_14795 [Ornithinimicrobium sp.]
MKHLEQAQRRAYAAAVGLGTRVRDYADEGERGDIPGWVMITVMSAGLVVVLTILARTLLADVFTSAMNSVVNP